MIGNSEVGHLHIGAGRCIPMDIQRIDSAIADGSFAEREPLRAFLSEIGGQAHVIGLIGEAGVHGLSSHLLAATRVLAAHRLTVQLHLLTDGRDSPPGGARDALSAVAANLPDGVRIATIGGRYFAMDRDRRWERVERAWRAIMLGEGATAPSAEEAIERNWRADITDEFIPPTVIGDYAGLVPGDGVLMTNFRSDRARQLAQSLADPSFAGFDRAGARVRGPMLGMVEFFVQPGFPIGAIFERRVLTNSLGQWVASHGLRQLRLAETEKFPHVTYFFDGGCEATIPGATQLMADSPKVATYDLAPEMAAQAITENYALAQGAGHDLTVMNFANPDMVGHTGDLDAAIRACEVVDRCLGRVIDIAQAQGSALLVTSDHGNCELMIDPSTGGPHTAHTISPVPVSLCGRGQATRLHDGTLSDLAPTILDLMGLDVPAEMTGRSLIEMM